MIPNGLTELELERFCLQTTDGGMTDEQAGMYLELTRTGDVKITVMQKRDGKWGAALLPSNTDGTLSGVLLAYDGQQVVIEADTGKGKGYLCGTDALTESYRAKGFTAYGIAQGVDRLKQKNPLFMSTIVHPPGVEGWTGITFSKIVEQF